MRPSSRGSSLFIVRCREARAHDHARQIGVQTVHCVSKKFPPLNSLQLCQILTDFQIFCTAGKRMKFATKSFDMTHLTLGTLLPYLGKLKILIFCRYLADMEESANKLNFNRL